MQYAGFHLEWASFQGRSRSLRLFFLSLSIFLILPAAFLSISGCGKHEAGALKQEAHPTTVSVVAVAPRDVPVAFEYIAQVQSSRQVSIRARVNGFLDKRVYTEGSVVKAGDTLFLMDQKPFKAQLDQANAALARQEAAFAVASQNLSRVKPLVAANALSQKDLDDAVGQHESTAAAVEQAKATMEEAKLNLSYTVIASPVAGITGAADQADGTYLSPSNNQLTTVAVISPVYVNFSISENDWLRYHNQLEQKLLIEPPDRKYVVELILADGSTYPLTGKVTFADPSFNAQTGTFLIRATVDNPDGFLRPNQYVRIHLKGASRPNAFLVPQRSVQRSSKGHYVWVVDKEKKAELRPVIVGEWFEDDWIINEGLHAGELVVADGTMTLRPGAAVEVKARDDASGAATAPSAESGSAKSGL